MTDEAGIVAQLREFLDSAIIMRASPTERRTLQGVRNYLNKLTTEHATERHDERVSDGAFQVEEVGREPIEKASVPTVLRLLRVSFVGVDAANPAYLDLTIEQARETAQRMLIAITTMEREEQK